MKKKDKKLVLKMNFKKKDWDKLKKIAALAHLSVENVINVLIAVEVISDTYRRDK